MKLAQQASVDAVDIEARRAEQRLTARSEYLAAFLHRSADDIVWTEQPYAHLGHGLIYETAFDGYQWRLEGDSADKWYAERAPRPRRTDRAWHLKIRVDENHHWENASSLAAIGQYIQDHPPKGGLPSTDAEPQMDHPEAAERSVAFGEQLIQDVIEREEAEGERRRSRRWRK